MNARPWRSLASVVVLLLALLGTALVPAGAEDDVGSPIARSAANPGDLTAGPEATLLAEPAAPELALTVHKRNDADGDGVFSDLEEVRGAGAAVPFRIGVRNPSAVPLTVVSVTDAMGGSTLNLLEEGYCPQLAGATLAPGAHLPCTFTLAAYLRTYAGEPRDELTNRVRVVATTGTEEVVAEDTSTVVNPNAGRISVAVVKTNDADGDGRFTRDEVAVEPGQTVTFQVTVHNTSPGTAILSSLTDTWDGLDVPIDLRTLCPALSEVRLRGAGGDGGDHDDDDGGGGCGGDDSHGDTDGGCGATHTDARDGTAAETPDHGDGGCGGDDHGGSGGCGGGGASSITCTFTLESYAPPAGGSLTNTVTATIAKPHDRTLTATASDTSTVSTPAAPAGDPDIALQQRIGLAGGSYRVHDRPPGLLVSIPLTGASVGYELEVTNTGSVTLTDLELEDEALDLRACSMPGALPPGGSFTCVVDPVPARVGGHVSGASVRASGAGRVVTAEAHAYYRGVAVAEPDRPPPSPPSGPDPTPPGGEDPTPSGPENEAGSGVRALRPGTARLATTASPLRATASSALPRTRTLPMTGAHPLGLLTAGLGSLGTGALLVRRRHR
jgi:LPXTG-motif cell wall-anchored protein